MILYFSVEGESYIVQEKQVAEMIKIARLNHNIVIYLLQLTDFYEYWWLM